MMATDDLFAIILILQFRQRMICLLFQMSIWQRMICL